MAMLVHTAQKMTQLNAVSQLKGGLFLSTKSQIAPVKCSRM